MLNPSVQRMLRGFARGVLLGAGSLATLILVICALIVVQGQRDETRPAGAAIVLGAAQWNGTPSPVLQARLDHALDLYRRGSVSRVILTGGVGQGDSLSEAAAGREYLVKRGLPDEALLLEEQGTTTWESLRSAADIARANGIGSVLLVSDPFHMLRSLKMAHDLGLIAYGSPTRTSPISENTIAEARYVLREAWAYVVYVFTRQ